jgi:hypothetical protein
VISSGGCDRLLPVPAVELRVDSNLATPLEEALLQIKPTAGRVESQRPG